LITPLFVTKTMSSPTTNGAAVCKAIHTIIAPMPIHKILGQPTNSMVNLLKHQVTKIAAAVKTTSWGGCHGHLALILNYNEYCIITINMTQMITCLIALPMVPTTLANNTMLILCAHIPVDHNLEWQEF
jgi:hypothetical protein